MTKLVPIAVFVALLSLAASTDLRAQRSAKDLATVNIDVAKPAVIGFLPPAMKASRGRDAIEAENTVYLAVNNVRICLGDDYANYRVVFADRIVLRSHGRERSFDVVTASGLVGALFFEPNASNPRILFAGGGPDALLPMLVPAASEYFGKQCGG